MGMSATAVAEVRTATGSDLNGGFYDATYGGVDYTQRDTPILTVPDLVTDGTDVVTSATGGFTPEMAGNAISIGPTGVITMITAVNSTNSITVLGAMAADVAKAARVGGALATRAKAFPYALALNVIWLTGSESTSSTINSGNYVIRGYGQVRGDDGFYVITWTGGATGTVLNVGNSDASNIQVDGGGATSITCIQIGAGTLYWCVAKNFGGNGFLMAQSRSALVDCRAIGAETYAGRRGVGLRGNDNVYGVAAYCEFIHCATGVSTVWNILLVNCRVVRNTNSEYARDVITLVNCTYDDASSTGIVSTKTHAIRCNLTRLPLALGNTRQPGQCIVHDNRLYGNAVDTQKPVVEPDAYTTLTDLPYMDADAGDYSLNDTPDAGAACRGLETTVPGSSTVDYSDVGAVQHEDSGGTGGTSGLIIIPSNWSD